MPSGVKTWTALRRERPAAWAAVYRHVPPCGGRNGGSSEPMHIHALHYAAIPVGDTVAHVDVRHAPALHQMSWHLCPKGYARSTTRRIAGRQYTLRMHRVVMQLSGIDIEGLQVDHINGDLLDNRNLNLRPATQTENSRNRRRKVGWASSRFKGVSWCNRSQNWRACIRVNGRLIWLGEFSREAEAAEAYDTAARLYFKAFAATGIRR